MKPKPPFEVGLKPEEAPENAGAIVAELIDRFEADPERWKSQEVQNWVKEARERLQQYPELKTANPYYVNGLIKRGKEFLV